VLWLTLGVATGLLLAACEDGYPIAPTACDDWCYATQRGGCAEDYPERCVSGCEEDALLTSVPGCETHWQELGDCYLAAPDESFTCHHEFETSQVPDACHDQRAELAECLAPGGGACFRNCRREFEACGRDLAECEFGCHHPHPGCEAEQQALSVCLVDQPITCSSPEEDTRSPEEIPCLAEIGALLDCAGWND
jgi:hypothetical protein